MDKKRKTRLEGYNLCKAFERSLNKDGYSIYSADVAWPCHNYVYYWFIAKNQTYKRFQTAVREVMKELKAMFAEKKSKKDQMLPMTDAFFTGMARRGFHYMRDCCYNDNFEEEIRVITTGCYMEKHHE